MLILIGMWGCVSPAFQVEAPAETSGIPSLATEEDSPSAKIPTLTEASPAEPGETPVPVETGSSPYCVSPVSDLALQVISYPDASQVILDFLNQGGSMNQLDDGLYLAGIANQPVAVVMGDYNGDGVMDIAVSIFNPASSAMPPTGQLLLFSCSGSGYILAYEDKPESDPKGGPKLLYWVDLTGDGADELVYRFSGCGAHTCYEQYRVLGWDGEIFSNRLRDDHQYAFSDIQIIEKDEGGIFDIEITSQGFGSVGAGPQRNIRYLIRFDPALGIWQEDSAAAAPSDYRIHMLHDADQFLQEGNYLASLTRYSRVANDPGLSDWLDPEIERKNLGAYAYYRMMTIYLALDDDATAQSILEEMAIRFTTGGSLQYVELAREYLDIYLTEGGELACQQAMLFAELHAEAVLAPIGPAYFGYANPEYIPSDVCLK